MGILEYMNNMSSTLPYRSQQPSPPESPPFLDYEDEIYPRNNSNHHQYYQNTYPQKYNGISSISTMNTINKPLPVKHSLPTPAPSQTATTFIQENAYVDAPPPMQIGPPKGGVSEYLDYDISDMASFVSLYANHNFDQCDGTWTTYITHVLTATRLPSCTILLSLTYLHSQTGFFPPPYRKTALITAFILANKFFDDNTFTNASWAEVSGLPVVDLNRTESAWLKRIEWNLFLTEDIRLEWARLNDAWNSFRKDSSKSLSGRATPLLIQDSPISSPLTPATPPTYPYDYPDLTTEYGTLGALDYQRQRPLSMAAPPYSNSGMSDLTGLSSYYNNLKRSSYHSDSSMSRYQYEPQLDYYTFPQYPMDGHTLNHHQHQQQQPQAQQHSNSLPYLYQPPQQLLPQYNQSSRTHSKQHTQQPNRRICQGLNYLNGSYMPTTSF